MLVLKDISYTYNCILQYSQSLQNEKKKTYGSHISYFVQGFVGTHSHLYMCINSLFKDSLLAKFTQNVLALSGCMQVESPTYLRV